MTDRELDRIADDFFADAWLEAYGNEPNRDKPTYRCENCRQEFEEADLLKDQDGCRYCEVCAASLKLLCRCGAIKFHDEYGDKKSRCLRCLQEADELNRLCRQGGD